MVRRAYSLTEMLVVIVIVAIVATMVVARNGGSDSSKLAGAAQVLVADLAFAQVESIAHSDDPRLVVFNTATNTYYLTKSSAQTTPLTNPVGKLPYQVTFGKGPVANLSGVKITAYSLGGDDRIQFGQYGQLDQTAPATIALTSGARTIIISIDPISGEASMGPIQ